MENELVEFLCGAMEGTLHDGIPSTQSHFYNFGLDVAQMANLNDDTKWRFRRKLSAIASYVYMQNKLTNDEPVENIEPPKLGRKPGGRKLPDNLKEMIAMAKEGKITQTAASKMCGMSIPLFRYYMLKDETPRA